MVMRSSPTSGSSVGMETAWDSLSLSAPPSFWSLHSLSVVLQKKKKKEKKVSLESEPSLLSIPRELDSRALSLWSHLIFTRTLSYQDDCCYPGGTRGKLRLREMRSHSWKGQGFKLEIPTSELVLFHLLWLKDSRSVDEPRALPCAHVLCFFLGRWAAVSGETFCLRPPLEAPTFVFTLLLPFPTLATSWSSQAD